MFAVARSFDEGGLIDVGEDDAAKYGAVVVGVFGLGECAERESAFFGLSENGVIRLVVGHIERIRGLEWRVEQSRSRYARNANIKRRRNIMLQDPR